MGEVSPALLDRRVASPSSAQFTPEKRSGAENILTRRFHPHDECDEPGFCICWQHVSVEKTGAVSYLESLPQVNVINRLGGALVSVRAAW